MPQRKMKFLVPGIIGFLMLMAFTGKFLLDHYQNHDDLIFMPEAEKSVENIVYREKAISTLWSYVVVEALILVSCIVFVFRYCKASVTSSH
jgi:hypothetical protein